jgi:hypothetical protein
MNPSPRKPFGILLMIAALAAYALAVSAFAPLIGRLPVLLQLPIYIGLGIAWMWPIRPLLRWTITGHWRAER